MKSDKAINAILGGKKVSRPSWGHLFYQKQGTTVKLLDHEGFVYGNFHLNQDELLADDWYIVKDKK